MSTEISVGLTTKKRESEKQLRDYAIELTREWSLKALGYDLTIDNKEGDIGFGTEPGEVFWSQLICFSMPDEKIIPFDTFTDKIAKRFPQMDLRKWETHDGPVCHEAVNIDGNWQEVKNCIIEIYVEKSDDFNILTNMMNDKELLSKYHIKKIDFVDKENFVVLTFDELMENEQEKVFSGIIGSINKLIPQSNIYCILVHDIEMGSRFVKKSEVRNGVLTWKDINDDDYTILNHYSDFNYDYKKPKKEYVKLLFKEGEERDTLLANIPSNLSNKDVELPF